MEIILLINILTTIFNLIFCFISVKIYSEKKEINKPITDLIERAANRIIIGRYKTKRELKEEIELKTNPSARRLKNLIEKGTMELSPQELYELNLNNTNKNE